MKSETPHTEVILRRSWSSASQEQIDAASHRVLHHLRSQASAAAEVSDASVVRVPRAASRRPAVASVAAALLLSVLVVWAAGLRQSPAPARKASEELLHREPEPLALLVGPSSASPGPPQNPEPVAPVRRLEFEVASIRPGIKGRITAEMLPPQGSRIYRRMDNARVDLGSIDLKALILMAYRMTSNQAEQVVGPDWLPEERFDIAAKLPEGGTVEQMPEMMQALLADRFKMQIHREQRRVPVFALVVGKPPLKLEEGSEDPTLFRGCNGGRGGHHECRNLTMKQVANQFSGMRVFDIDRPVVDKTDLKGAYNFDLDYGLVGQYPRETGVPLPTRTMDAPGFVSIADAFKAVGLKLEERQEIFEFIVVDHIERTPTPN